MVPSSYDDPDIEIGHEDQDPLALMSPSHPDVVQP